MKHLTLRGDTWYYRKRIPKSLSHLSTVNVIYRPLSIDKTLAKQLSARYDSLFVMIDAGLKLDKDISALIKELNIHSVKKIDIYEKYINSLNVSDNRLSKIRRLLKVLKLLLPKDISVVNMTIMDEVKSTLSVMPKRSTSKYRLMDIMDIIKTKADIVDRMSTETLNDHLKILNSLMKFAYERDLLNKPYNVPMAKNIASSRDERIALDEDSVLKAINGAKTRELANSFTLLYLTGMRPSEVYKCKISTLDGIKCFDLTDKSLKLKSKSSHRLIPVHSAIANPEQFLKDYKTMSGQYLNRQFDVQKGTLYSLRHSFATTLASEGVEPHMISELLGHTHAGMTLGRYVKGFPVKLLSNRINKLSYV